MSGSVIKADICVVGAGSGGLSVAAGAAQMGAATVLIEKDKMGGDCLNYGCVPSKSLLAAAHHAQAMRSGAPFGVTPGGMINEEPKVDFARTHQHVHEVIAEIAPHDSVERFESLGVNVIKGAARFIGPRQVEAAGQTIEARRFVIATGSSAGVPPIRGLDTVPYFTNETIFDNTVLPDHLIIIGAGPIGMEMAQAHRQLGARVTVLEAIKALPQDDADAAAIVINQLTRDGVTLHEGVQVKNITQDDTGAIQVTIGADGREDVIEGSHLLVAAGRKPNVDGLNLEAAGIVYSGKGIQVDARLRTTNRRVFAIGDVAGGYQFTHVANYHAGIVIRNALFRLPAKATATAIPWVTYTDPELAQVGLTEAAAREQHGDRLRVLTWPIADNDRARAERITDGIVKVVTTPKGKILGATIAAPQAGELIQPWVLAMSSNLKIRAMADYIAPYPTLGEVNKRVAGSFYTVSLFSPKVRFLVRLLAKLG